METTTPSSRRDFLMRSGAAAIALSFGELSGCRAKGPSLNFCNWDMYTGATTLSDFKKATGVTVGMSLISSDDELFAKLRGGNRGYDVIVPSGEFVGRMLDADMLMSLDRALIPNFKNISPDFRDADFDPGRRYSMPYTWTVLGIGYRKSKTGGIPTSWKWVFDSSRYAGRIGVTSDSSELCRLALKYLGYDLNTTDRAALARVEQLMIRQKPNIAVFHDDNGQDLLLAGDIDIVVEYNGDVASVMREDPDLAFVVPDEGSMRSADSLCIPKGAPRPDLAHMFINYMLDARAGAEISRTILYPTPNAAAAALMPASYRNNSAIFPPAALLNRCQYARYNGEAMQHAYEDIVTRIRAA